MRSQGELAECQFTPCSAFVRVTAAGLVAAHPIALRKGAKPCPGGSWNTRGNEKAEFRKMRERQLAQERGE